MPRSALLRVAIGSFLICVAIELQQIYQAPWAVRFRNNRVAGTFLGHGFLWVDLVRYAVGTVIGVGVAIVAEGRWSLNTHAVP